MPTSKLAIGLLLAWLHGKEYTLILLLSYSSTRLFVSNTKDALCKMMFALSLEIYGQLLFCYSHAGSRLLADVTHKLMIDMVSFSFRFQDEGVYNSSKNNERSSLQIKWESPASCPLGDITIRLNLDSVVICYRRTDCRERRNGGERTAIPFLCHSLPLVTI